jgi:hypothetical protein
MAAVVGGRIFCAGPAAQLLVRFRGGDVKRDNTQGVRRSDDGRTENDFVVDGKGLMAKASEKSEIGIRIAQTFPATDPSCGGEDIPRFSQLTAKICKIIGDFPRTSWWAALSYILRPPSTK